MHLGRIEDDGSLLPDPLAPHAPAADPSAATVEASDGAARVRLPPRESIRGKIAAHLDRKLGPGAAPHIGWTRDECAPTRDVTARFEEIVGHSKGAIGAAARVGSKYRPGPVTQALVTLALAKSKPTSP